MKWTDNPDRCFSKAFQGLTVSCARCHDHKFDAISQRDYYALYGVFASARPVQRAVDSPISFARTSIQCGPPRTGSGTPSRHSGSHRRTPYRARLRHGDDALDRAIETAACDPNSLLYPWTQLSDRTGDDLTSEWQNLVAEGSGSWRVANDSTARVRNRLETHAGGHRMDSHRDRLEGGASSAGEFSIVPMGTESWRGSTSRESTAACCPSAMTVCSKHRASRSTQIESVFVCRARA